MEAEIGIIGGSGFYSMIENATEVRPKTKYGDISDVITLGMISGRKVAFLPRHGKNHTITPGKIPYRANIEALNSLGVTRIIATSAVGSLNERYAPKDIVFFDQFVNMTSGRTDTFYDEETVAHIGMAEPYCKEMRAFAGDAAEELMLRYKKSGTVVVINGPRFSTKAESRMFGSMGFDTVNMTQYPEVALARERGICYLGIGMVTDYDVGLEGRDDILPVTTEEVTKVFGETIGKTKSLILNMIPKIPQNRSCSCKNALEGAFQTKK